MAFPKSPKRSTAPQGSQPATGAAPNQGTTEPTSKKRDVWGDVDKDGDFDINDVVIASKNGIDWLLPRIPMVAYGAITIVAGGINIAAWTGIMAGTGAWAFPAGLAAWAVLQSKELEPMWAELNVKASLATLIRFQRKPLEIPVLNHDLNPHAAKALKNYRNREKNAHNAAAFMRWAAYGLELFVLCGGPLVSPLGINWGAVLLALIGFTGVELGIRGFSHEGEKLLTAEEREYTQQILKAVSRQSVKLT